MNHEEIYHSIHRKKACKLVANRFREPLNILRAWIGEKIFRQSKQNFARIVDPLRRNFVTNDEKDSVDSMCVEFLEVPFTSLLRKRKLVKGYFALCGGRGDFRSLHRAAF